MNEQFGEKVKAIFDSITVLQAKDSDLKRDNANINGDSPMGAMLQYGANTAKEYNLEYLIKPAIAELHRDGWIHIHDLDFYAWTTTCTQIELLKHIDVLVDGLFVQAEKSLDLDFRGSRNQRVIDIPESLKEGVAILKQT